MKIKVCDICGNRIWDLETDIKNRYIFWFRDPYAKKSIFPKRMDICEDCKKAITDTILRKRYAKAHVEKPVEVEVEYDD